MKYVKYIIALALILTLAACGGNTAATDGDAPNGEVTVTPPQTQEPTPSDEPSPAEPILPDPSQEPDASVLVTPPAPPAPAADISELTLNEQAMSLSAQTGADGVITFTYIDTSIKPSYVSDGETEYVFAVYGTNADGEMIIAPVFRVNSQAQNDGTHILDMASLQNSDGTVDSPIVTADGDGLTLEWKSERMEGTEADGFGAFALEIGLFIGNEPVWVNRRLPIELAEIL